MSSPVPPTVLPVVRASSPESPPAAATASATGTFFDEVGGEPTFRALVARFYAGIADDPVLRPLYPEDDLEGAEERLRMFLIQYWGGPRTYTQRRGHPRLRMRHVPFAIGERERLAWLGHMHDAIEAIGMDEAHAATLWRYLESAALSLQNRPEQA